MTRLLRPLACLALTLPLWLTAGCKQGANERCQVDSDCDTGLTCHLGTNSREVGGTCQGASTGDLSASPTDFSRAD